MTCPKGPCRESESAKLRFRATLTFVQYSRAVVTLMEATINNAGDWNAVNGTVSVESVESATG